MLHKEFVMKNSLLVDQEFAHLKANLLRICPKNSYLNHHLSLLNFENVSYKDWLEKKLLPNTRLIVEPKIKGSTIALHYEKGILKRAFNKKEKSARTIIKEDTYLPKQLPTEINIQIMGQLYKASINNQEKSQPSESKNINNKIPSETKMLFCAFQIVNTNLNHFSQIIELKKLGFEVPETECVKFTSEVDLYMRLWEKGKLFSQYPTDGIILKVNSRKLQKQLGENNLAIQWAYAIKR